MAVDVVSNLENALTDALASGEILRRALADERETAERLREDIRDFRAAAAEDFREIRRLEAELAAARFSQSVTTAALPDHTAERQTATAHIACLAATTGTGESTIRGNLTLSPVFAPLRDNAAAIDGVPLTQSERLTDWLTDSVMDDNGHYRTRYEQLLRRYLSVEAML